LIGLVLAIAATAMSVTSAVGATHAAKAKIVTVDDDFYSPTKLTIKKGSTVRWVWQNGGTNDPHTVTENHGRFSSHEMMSGSYAHRFTKVGSYVIFCEVHPDEMRIRVTVRR